MSLSRSEAGRLGYLKSKVTRDENRLKAKQSAIEEYEKDKKFCKFCNTELSFEYRNNAFCNSSCSAKLNNKNKKKEKLCFSCGKQIVAKNKYCSLSCQHDKARKDAIEKGTISSISAKTYLIKLYGAKCMDCGWNKVNPTTNLVPIELEHIDGNSENNDLSNLKLLCPCCHSLTPTYKALNRGNGRHERRKRYKEGKSF